MSTFPPRTFLLDENVPVHVMTQLRAAGYPAARVLEVGLSSQPDTIVFAYARRRQLTFITFDTDYLSQAKFPPPHAGILVLRFFPRGTSVKEIAVAVLSAVTWLASQDISNRVYRVDPSGVYEES
jgi:predicted nuclease of predicted toxin-antitoxin system